jgi:farnesyl-diphosphate farnesyltransferase
MASASHELLTTLLKDVSRSFYTTLRVLPAPVRPQIGLAYLLARTTDTIADTEIVPVDQRSRALEAFRDRILGKTSAPLEFGELARSQGSGAERRLLEQSEASLALLQTFSESDRQRIRRVLDIIVSGQELDLCRFAGASADRIVALDTDAELDDYTYRVAGCVGEFWTAMCLAHLFRVGTGDEARLMADGVRFGKGLQLVNILRDIPRDLRQGRCYLPMEELATAGLAPADLLKPENERRLRPLYNRYLDATEAHLAAGWDYTNRIPRNAIRVRLACAWPILIGIRTVRRLRTGNVIDPNQRIKISRQEVYGIMLQSILRYPFAGMWNRLGTRI